MLVIAATTDNMSEAYINGNGWRLKHGLSYDLATNEQLGYMYDLFGTNALPHNVVIGKDYKLYQSDYTMSEYAEITNWLNELSSVQIIKQIDDFIIEYEDVQFNLEEYFGSLSQQEISYQVTVDKPQVLHAEITDNVLNLSRNEGYGRVYIKVTASMPDGESRSIGFHVRVFEPLPYAGFGNALRFDGIDNMLDAGSNEELNSLDSLTINCRLKLDKNSCRQGIIAKELDGSQSWYLELLTSNALKFSVYGDDGSNRSLYSEAKLDTGRWYDLAASYDGKVMKLFIAGQPVSYQQYDTEVFVKNEETHSLTMGDVKDKKLFGCLDNISLWHKSLTDNEVNRLKSRILSDADEEGLTAYWSFDERHGMETADLRGYSNAAMLGMVLGDRISADAPVIMDAIDQELSYPYLPANYITADYRFEIVSEPEVGTVTIEDEISGKFSYLSPAGYNGETEFTYRLYDGVELYSEVITVRLHVETALAISKEITAETFTLYQNFPNPFNPATSIGFAVTGTENIRLSVFNVNGQLVKELVNRELTAGQHTVNFNASGLNSGIYYYTLESGNGERMTKKMMLVK